MTIETLERAWFNKEPLLAKLGKFVPVSVSRNVSYAFKSLVNGDGNFEMPEVKAQSTTLMIWLGAIGLMDYLEINKAHIVGASMGGMITQVIGLDYPDRG